MAKISIWRKFVLLLWKNWLQQSKLCLIISFAIFFGVFSFLAWFSVHIIVKGGEIEKRLMSHKEVDISNLQLFMQYAEKVPKLELLYSPNTSQHFDSIIKDAANSLELDGYRGYANAKDLERALSADDYLAGVQFDGNAAYPNKLSYALRFPQALRTTDDEWHTDELFDTSSTGFGVRDPSEDDGGTFSYLREGFLPVQQAVSMAYLKLAGKQKSLPNIVMQRYPYSMGDVIGLIWRITHFTLKLFIIATFMYPAINITKRITVEKEMQLKEVMKIMGLNNWLQWMAWFVNSFIVLVIPATLIMIAFKIKWKFGVCLLNYSSFTAVYFFIIIYLITMICFCFMIAVLCKKATVAVIVTSLILIISFLPYAFLTYDEMGLGKKLGLSFLVNTAVSFGFTMIFRLEMAKEGLHWSNMFKSSEVYPDDLTVGAVMLIMLTSCIIFLLICFYVEQVFPGDFGIPKKWYFPFTKEFWHPSQKHIASGDISSNDNKRHDPSAFESEPTGKHVGIQARNLTKQYGEQVAVRNLSMNIYEDEITVLMGHNGAGKTTTFSMLVGMIPPSAGTAFINGYDIRTNTDNARDSLSICPQHNVLFDNISVANHIKFYSRLKGMKGETLKREVDKYLHMINLKQKANVHSSKLSGGMKRKLSICCALCGGTKVVLCDEPSSGLDPSARRELWDLLLAEKTGRTLFLSTHFMDEADVLGDRIAILHESKLMCFGTPFFLKKKYGSGYHLICFKLEGCDVNLVTALLRHYITDITPVSDIGTELKYRLPDKYSSVFEKMFIALENNSANLKLGGFGVSISSMEEVFSKVGAEISQDNDNVSQRGTASHNVDLKSTHYNQMISGNAQLLRGIKYHLNQVHAMFLKKLLYTWRHMFLTLLQILIPVMAISLVYRKGVKEYSPPKALPIDLMQYRKAVIALETQQLTPNSLESEIAAQYKSIVSSLGAEYTFETTSPNSFETYIQNMMSKNKMVVDSQYLAAATVRMGKITAWLNNQLWHTAPLTVNLVHNAMARSLIGSQAEIKVKNAPLSSPVVKLENDLSSISYPLLVGMCLASIFYAIPLIKERSSSSTLLQFISGVKVWTFWLTHLIWDFALFSISVILIIIIVACFPRKGFPIFEELGPYSLILLLFGLSALTFTYLISYYFTRPSSGFIFFNAVVFITALILPIAEHMALMTVSPSTAHKLKTLFMFFRIFPYFSLAKSLQNLDEFVSKRGDCSNPDVRTLPVEILCMTYPKCCSTWSYFDWKKPGVLPEVVFMTCSTVLFFLLIVVRDHRTFWRRITSVCNRTPPKRSNANMDDDVLKEEERILAMSKNELADKSLVLKNVSKYYCCFLAVNQVSFCVEQKECFGLLGVNGAGKTTTFKMMTGDINISHGTAYVTGLNLATDLNKIYKKIGYCPQFDALIGDFTGRETLKIYALLHGMHRDRIPKLCEEMAESFGFSKYLDEKFRAYSGGNKRKLSAAIAILGNPSVVFLDEPTTGLDPGARRQLWNIICRVRDSGKSIVLTSHNMDECEALCTRLIVMVKGKLKCIGSLQQLKTKFSKGLVLKIKVKRAVDKQKEEESKKSLNNDELQKSKQRLTEQDGVRVQNVKDFVMSNFPKAKLQDEYYDQLTYYIPVENIKWSQIFGLMESNRDALKIADYAIGQTSLEEIFLGIAKS